MLCPVIKSFRVPSRLIQAGMEQLDQRRALGVGLGLGTTTAKIRRPQNIFHDRRDRRTTGSGRAFAATDVHHGRRLRRED